jgi:integrase
MQKHTLTDRALKALKPAPAGKRYDVMDAVVPGFGVRVTDKRKRTFVLVARYPGANNPTRRALGEYGALTLEKAREKARRWIELIQRETDPKNVEEQERQAAARNRENSFEVVAETFITRHVSKLRSGAEVARAIRREFGGICPDDEYFPGKRKGDLTGPWAGRPITSITQHDVIAIIDAVVDRDAPYQAHNLLSYIRRFFNWVLGRPVYGLQSSPCDRIRPTDAIGPKKKRKRILNEYELRAFWKCTHDMGYPYGPLFQLFLVTGQRESMVCEGDWSEIELEKAVWSLSAERMKSNDPFVVPLSSLAISIINGLPRFEAGQFLFSSTLGKSPIRGNALSKPKRRLDKAMLAELKLIHAEQGKDPKTTTLPKWVFHDLRRTMRTGLSALPIPHHVREFVIGHVRPEMEETYDLFAYLEERRDALERWAARVRDIVEPAPANVTPLRRQGDAHT